MPYKKQKKIFILRLAQAWLDRGHPNFIAALNKQRRGQYTIQSRDIARIAGGQHHSQTNRYIMNHQDSYCEVKRKPARAEEKSGKRTRKQLKCTHEDNTASYSDAIETTRISAKPHEDFTNFEEEDDDSYWSTNGEGRDQQDNSCTATATRPGDDTPPALYAARKETNHTNAGCDVLESDKLNDQSDESCEHSSNDENKQLRQHYGIEKRMEANRLRAKATRRKKKVMIEEMRSKIFVLTVKNEKLKNHNRVQQTEIEFLRNIQGGQHQQQVSLYDFIDFYGGARRISIIPPCIVHEYIHGIEWVLITAFAHSRISQCSHYHHLCKTQWPIEETELL